LLGCHLEIAQILVIGIHAKIGHTAGVRIEAICLRERVKANAPFELFLLAECDGGSNQNAADPAIEGRLSQFWSIPRRVFYKLDINEILSFLLFNATPFHCGVDDHHALGHAVANDAESRVGQHPLQRFRLFAPVPVPALGPVASFDTGAMKLLNRLEQLRNPFTLPIAELLVGYAVP